MNAAENSTIIGKSVKIRGDLSGSENLMMDGELEGSIHLPGGNLTLGPSSRVRAHIVARDVVVYGRLEGDIRATGRVELRASALMQGNIYAGSLSIEENAAFRGKVDPSRAGETAPELPEAPLAATPAAASAASSAASTAPLPFRAPASAPAQPSYGGRSLSQLPAALAVAAAAAAASRAPESAKSGAEDTPIDPLLEETHS